MVAWASPSHAQHWLPVFHSKNSQQILHPQVGYPDNITQNQVDQMILIFIQITQKVLNALLLAEEVGEVGKNLQLS